MSGDWVQNLRDIRSVISSGRSSRSSRRGGGQLRYPATGMTIDEIRAQCRAQGQQMFSQRRELADWYEDYEAGRTTGLPCGSRRGTRRRRRSNSRSSQRLPSRRSSSYRRPRSRQSMSAAEAYSHSSLGRNGVSRDLVEALVMSGGLVDALTNEPSLIPLVMNHPKLAKFVAESPNLIQAMSKQPELIDQIVKGVQAPATAPAQQEKEATKSVLETFLSSIGADKSDVTVVDIDKQIDALVKEDDDTLSEADVAEAIALGRRNATPSFRLSMRT